MQRRPWCPGKRLSRKKLARLVPKHSLYVEPLAGYAWVYRGCKELGKCKAPAILSDISCKITKAREHARGKTDATSICGKDYAQIIRKYDGKDTFFMLDPPYPEACKGSQFAKDGLYKQHCKFDYERLGRNLKNVKGKFLLTTSVDMKPKFCDRYRCRTVTTTIPWLNRKFKDLAVMNY